MPDVDFRTLAFMRAAQTFALAFLFVPNSHHHLFDPAQGAERGCELALHDAPQRRGLDRHLARDGDDRGAHAGAPRLPHRQSRAARPRLPADPCPGDAEPAQPGLGPRHRCTRPQRASSTARSPTRPRSWPTRTCSRCAPSSPSASSRSASCFAARNQAAARRRIEEGQGPAPWTPIGAWRSHPAGSRGRAPGLPSFRASAPRAACSSGWLRYCRRS